MSDSQVIRDMQRFKRALLKREVTQMKAMARTYARLGSNLQDQMELLARDLADRKAAGLPISKAAVYRLERYQSLLQQMRLEYATYASYAADVIEENATALIDQAGERVTADIAGATAGRLNMSLNRLPIEAIKNLAGFVADGTPLNAWLNRNVITAEMADKVVTALERGTALGINPRKVARQMKDSLSGGLQQSLNTARTVQLNAFREAYRQQMAASGVVSGYRRLSARDGRVCMACLMADGEFIPLDRPMPEHNQGRCTAIPVVDGFAEPEYERGRDWFVNQSPDIQEALMGRGRYVAWSQGRFDLDQLITVRRDAVWGDSIQPTPLNQLVPA